MDVIKVLLNRCTLDTKTPEGDTVLHLAAIQANGAFQLQVVREICNSRVAIISTGDPVHTRKNKDGYKALDLVAESCEAVAR